MGRLLSTSSWRRWCLLWNTRTLQTNIHVKKKKKQHTYWKKGWIHCPLCVLEVTSFAILLMANVLSDKSKLEQGKMWSSKCQVKPEPLPKLASGKQIWYDLSKYFPYRSEHVVIKLIFHSAGDACLDTDKHIFHAHIYMSTSLLEETMMSSFLGSVLQYCSPDGQS